jgi:hypothetical protein
MQLALEVKTFISNLHLRWVPVQSPILGRMNLPLITSIDIAERERERYHLHIRDQQSKA